MVNVFFFTVGYCFAGSLTLTIKNCIQYLIVKVNERCILPLNLSWVHSAYNIVHSKLCKVKMSIFRIIPFPTGMNKEHIHDIGCVHIE